MSLDGAFLHLIKSETEKRILGGRVDKIHQPSKDEIIISFRSGSGTERLLVSANPDCARVGFTSAAPENPKAPPMFCMLLRKHLGGGKLVGVSQDGLERIINFDFECMNEIGDMVRIRLAVEIMGRCSNIILMTDKNGETRVIDSIKRVTDDVSSVRRLLPNVVYELPPREERLCLIDCDISAATDAVLSKSSMRLAKAIMQTFEGISPLFARECAYFTAKDVDIIAEDTDTEKRQRLEFFLKKAKAVINGEAPPEFTVVKELNGKPKDFCFVSVEQYSTAMIITHVQSASELLDSFYGNRAVADRMKQRSAAMLKMLMNTYERISRKLEAQKAELSQTKERERFRVCGDIIAANIYRMEKGMNELVTDDYINGGEITIKLDNRLSPSQNAQKYFSEYRKMETAEKMLTKLIKDGEQELLYVDSVFDEVSRTTGESELLEIRQELMQSGYMRKTADNRKADKQLKAQPPMKFRSSDGFEILVGRNNLQNDKLTLKTALPNDLWLHTQNIAGSHVIVSGTDIPDNTIVEAATLAAYCSKARNGTKIPVDYTLVRYVKKPNGTKPGMVIFTNNKTILVNPDEELFNRLKS